MLSHFAIQTILTLLALSQVLYGQDFEFAQDVIHGGRAFVGSEGILISFEPLDPTVHKATLTTTDGDAVEGQAHFVTAIIAPGGPVKSLAAFNPVKDEWTCTDAGDSKVCSLVNFGHAVKRVRLFSSTGCEGDATEYEPPEVPTHRGDEGDASDEPLYEIYNGTQLIVTHEITLAALPHPSQDRSDGTIITWMNPLNVYAPAGTPTPKSARIHWVGHDKPYCLNFVDFQFCGTKFDDAPVNSPVAKVEYFDNLVCNDEPTETWNVPEDVREITGVDVDDDFEDDVDDDVDDDFEDDLEEVPEDDVEEDPEDEVEE